MSAEKQVLVGIVLVIAIAITLYKVDSKYYKDMQCKCIDKQISWDKYGDMSYHIIYRREDGVIEVRAVGSEDFYNTEKGRFYFVNVNTRDK